MGARVEVLVVDDDPSLRGLLRTLLARNGYAVSEAEDGSEAIEMLSRSFDLVITDLIMPRADGFEVMQRVRERHPKTPVIMLTGEGDIRACVRAMRAGAFNFLTKPCAPPELLHLVEQAVLPRGRGETSRRSGATMDEQSQVALVGESEALLKVIDSVERVAKTDSTVLITGESGTGKEVVVRLLHGSSRRSLQPFVAINCGAIPESLIESELFGHARGAFTGATEARPGKFLQANGGTIFLDEIAELPLPLQVKLLRVLQEREVTALGDTRVRAVDVRVIAATNRNLETMVREGSFRADLFYRLDVLRVQLPPLRERRGDIRILARHFLSSMNRRFDREVKLGDDALAVMGLYDWPGNVREMENLFERLVVLNRSGTVHADDLPEQLQASSAETIAVTAASKGLVEGPIDFQSAVEGFEHLLIEHALRQTGGNKTRAAELLGLRRTTMLDKLRR